MPKLHVLGSGGWVPTPQRQTCCYLVETRRVLVFLDCGSGLARLHDPAFQVLLKRHKRALVLLSHWHHDHVEGLHYLPFFLGHMEVVLAAPGAGILGTSPEEVLERYGGEPLLPVPFSRWSERFAGGWSVQEVRPGRNEFLGEEVIATVQPHVGPSVGYRVRDVAYVTDTCVRDETVALAEDAAVLIHDAYLDEEAAAQDPRAATIHGVSSGVARLAAQARVGELLLGHVNPAYDQPRLDRMLLATCEIFRRTILATDMQVLEVRASAEEEEDLVPGSAGDDVDVQESADDCEESVGDSPVDAVAPGREPPAGGQEPPFRAEAPGDDSA